MKNKNFYEEFNQYFNDEMGLLRLAKIIDTAATEMQFAVRSANNGIDPAKLIVKSHEDNFNSDIDETLKEFFQLRSIIHKLLNLKFENHELCNYIVKPNETKRSWLCFSGQCKNPDSIAFNLLNY